MLTAKKARKLAEDKNHIMNNLLEPFLDRIKFQARHGFFEVKFFKTDEYFYTEEVIMELMRLGYLIWGDSTIDKWIIIKW